MLRIPILFLCLFCLTSCATKYIVPTNRFVTPEVHGEAFRGQFDLGQTNANSLVINTRNNDVDHGVLYNETARTALNLETGLMERFDFLWLHNTGANSMLGGKFQFVGGSRSSNTLGHKFALAALFGGNEHETDDESVEFTLNGKEFMALYGYRVYDWLLAYSNFSYATYDFEGKISSTVPALDGLRPKLSTHALGLSGGLEFLMGFLVSKVECTYQQLDTTDSKNKSRLVIGYTLGLNW